MSTIHSDAPSSNQRLTTQVQRPSSWSIWKRLLWKDFRELLPIWLTVLFGAAVCLFLINLNPLTGGSRNPSAYRVPTLICCQSFAVLACVINGVLLFALERENRTHQMLSGLPIQPKQVIWAKLLLGLTASFAVVFILSWSGSFVTRAVSGSLPESGLLVDAEGGRQALLLIGPIAFFLIAAFAALAVGSTMNAFVIAGFIASIASMPTNYIGLDNGLYESTSFVPAVILAGLAVVLLGVVALEAQRWIEGRSRNFLSKFQRQSSPEIEVSSVEQVNRAKTIQAGRSFPVLMWQSWRIALPKIGHWLLAMVGMSAVFLLSAEFDENLALRELGLLVVPAVVAGLSLLFCATIFQADHQGGLYRFYQQHVERPRWFWLTRLIPWLVATMGLALLVSYGVASVIRLQFLPIEGGASHPELFGYYLYDHAFAFTTIIILTALAIGQFWSMFVRNFVIAIVISLITGGVVYWYTGQLIFLGESLTVFLLPLLITLFWATWYRSKYWLADSQAWRSYAIPISSVLAVTCLTLCGFAYHRAYSLEDAQLDTNNIAAVLWPFSVHGTPAEREETAKMYRKAIDGLSFENTNSARRMLELWDAAKQGKDLDGDELEESDLAYPDYDKKVNALVKSNQKSIKLMLKASKRVGCDPFLDARREDSRRDKANRLRSLMMANSLVLLETDQNDEALESILAFDRVTQRTAFEDERSRTRMPIDLVYDLLIRWSERPNQDAEKVKEMIWRLEHTPSNQQPETFKWQGEAEWFRLIHLFQDIEQNMRVWVHVSQMSEPPSPWEKERGKRLLKQIAIEDFNRYYWTMGGYNDRQLPNPWEDFSSRSETASFTRLADRRAFGLQTDRDAESHLRAYAARRETLRRYTLLRLALSAYAIENGNYPQHLYELTGYFEHSLPKTVHTGSNFGWLPEGLPAQGFYPHDYGDAGVIKPNLPVLLPFAIDQPFDMTKREPFTLVKDDKDQPREGIPVPVLNERRYSVSIEPYLSRQDSMP